MTAIKQTIKPRRWVLVLAELLVGGWLVVWRFDQPALKGYSLGLSVLGMAVFIPWVFLFFGSPFLVRSQRWLAVLGWCIAVSALLF